MPEVIEQLRYCSFFTTHPEHWAPCSKEHHDMVKANPQEWPGYEARALVAIPSDDVLVPLRLLQQAATWTGIASRWQIQDEIKKQLAALHDDLRSLYQEKEGDA
jgi:NAD-dependent oxidoreductase involved in siderophore biosynthesis